MVWVRSAGWKYFMIVTSNLQPATFYYIFAQLSKDHITDKI
jgi:hypothetical protein